jgi:hypothetical protein
MTQTVHLQKAHRITYRMFAKANAAELTDEYFLCATHQKDFICVSLGCDRDAATEIYHTLTKGEVTPCTVMDVLQDLEACFQKCTIVAENSFVLASADETENIQKREDTKAFDRSLIG